MQIANMKVHLVNIFIYAQVVTIAFFLKHVLGWANSEYQIFLFHYK